MNLFHIVNSSLYGYYHYQSSSFGTPEAGSILNAMAEQLVITISRKPRSYKMVLISPLFNSKSIRREKTQDGYRPWNSFLKNTYSFSPLHMTMIHH